MKSLFSLTLISLLGLLSSCLSTGEDPFEDGVNRSPLLRSIEVSASRDYNPSRWQNGVIAVEQNGLFHLPTELQVLAGHIGTGWASISIGGRKFCYQGNASSNNQDDGTSFQLRFEKLSPNDECHHASTNIPYQRDISLQSGQLITLQVHGGGCGTSCNFLELEARINPR